MSIISLEELQFRWYDIHVNYPILFFNISLWFQLYWSWFFKDFQGEDSEIFDFALSDFSGKTSPVFQVRLLKIFRVNFQRFSGRTSPVFQGKLPKIFRQNFPYFSRKKDKNFQDEIWWKIQNKIDEKHKIKRKPYTINTK